MKATTSGTGQGRTYGGQSSGERQAERKERLIRAAIATYGEQGYRHTTVSDVCRMAGLTPRYFYESFVNSEALLIAAYKAVTRIALETQQAAASELDEAEPEARLQAMLSAYYALLRDKPTAARVFVTEMSGISPAVDAAFDHGLAKFARLLARTLDSEWRETDMPTLRETGAMHGLLAIARSWIARGCKEPISDVVAIAMPFCRLLIAKDSSPAMRDGNRPT